MNHKPEFSQCVMTRTRAYFIDAVRLPSGGMYMQVTEREFNEDYDKAKRWSITIYPENIGNFAEAFSKVADFISNSQNEK